jgi:prepilin-type N-terminal cleavage/methylation domain-containing protein
MLIINKKLSKQGFSLIELMVAAAILAIVIVGIFLAFGTGFQGMTDTRDRTVATNYAREKMEDIKNKSFGEITYESPPAYIPGQTKFKREVTLDDSIANLKKVTTTVSWKNRKNVDKEVELVTWVYNL